MSEPIIKYKTGGWRLNAIERVECVKESESSVWTQGTNNKNKAPNRHAKRTEYGGYFDSWEQAREDLLAKAQQKVDSARRNLQFANDLFGNIKGMKKPEGT